MNVLTCAISLEPESKKRQCKVLFEYIPQNEDELELKLGDVIDIIDEVSCSTELAIHVLRVKPLLLADYLYYRHVGKIAWEVVFLQLKLLI